MKITDALLGEHALLYLLLDHCENGAAARSEAATKDAGAALAAALLAHASTEDELLFAPLEPHLPREAGPLAVMRAEHETIEGGLARLPNAADATEARALLAEVVATAREHFAKEEQVLFRMAESMLAPAMQEELGARWARRRFTS